MLLAYVLALNIGAVSYCLCRWMFCIWRPLGLIAPWLTLFVFWPLDINPNYMGATVLIILPLMLVSAPVGAFFFGASTAGEWVFVGFKYLACFFTLLPLEYICFLSALATSA